MLSLAPRVLPSGASWVASTSRVRSWRSPVSAVPARRSTSRRRTADDREAFGSPLARFEGVSFPLAEHATTLEAARLVCDNALWLRNQGLRHTAEAAMAKWYGPLMASQAVKDCLLLHGNYGYAREYGLEQRLRDVMAVEIADGTAQIQKIIIARELFGREFVPYRKQ